MIFMSVEQRRLIHIPIGSMGNGVFTYEWFIMNGNCFVN